jgi:hypothetical protein
MLVRGRVAKLTQAPKIQPALKTSLSHFEIALDKLEKDYLGKIPKGDNRSDALNKFQKIRASVYRLAVIANNIAANESVKNPSDAELKKILEETFTGNLALSTPVALDLELSKNDLVKIIDKLKTHKTLGLKRAEDSGELIKALGLAVGVGLAEERGLPITKVIGLNDDSLNKIKQDFGLANHEFGLYATTRAQKVYERFSSAKQHPNIYVIFADELSSGADLAKIIEIFTQDNNKIIIIADRPEEYSPHSTYVAAGLNGVTGYYVARAVAEAMYPNDINLDQKVEPLVKLFYVQGRAGQMNLVSLPLAVKDTMLRLQQGTKELKAVEETLESLKKEPLELKKLNIPRVLGDSFRKIEVNKADKNYYFMRTF